jgi:hypothetical protein
LRSEINSPDLDPWFFARFRAVAPRAINSPTFFPDAASLKGAISFAAPNTATNRFTLAGFFDGEFPRRCGTGSPLNPQEERRQSSAVPQLIRNRNGWIPAEPRLVIGVNHGAPSVLESIRAGMARLELAKTGKAHREQFTSGATAGSLVEFAGPISSSNRLRLIGNFENDRDPWPRAHTAGNDLARG